MAKVCRVWRVPRSTVYHQRKQKMKCGLSSKRRGRKPRIDTEHLLAEIRRIIAETQALGFYGEGYRKIWAKLRVKGINVDKERVRIVMRDNDLLAPHRAGNPNGPREHTGTIIPSAPNVMWGTDATSTHTLLDGAVTVFAAVDHFTAECIGIHAAVIGNRFEALEPIRQGVKDYYGGYTKHIANNLLLRHDHGSQYMSKDFQKELKYLGITSSPSFVRNPEGNGVIERFFRTLKEQLLWAKSFNDVEQLLFELQEFKQKYNKYWIIQRHGYRTPHQVRKEWKTDMMDAA